MADSPPLRVWLVGVASGDLDRLRRRLAADPLVEIVGATTVEQATAGTPKGVPYVPPGPPDVPPKPGVPSSVDAVILTPEAHARMRGVRERQTIRESPAEALTARERDVLTYVAEGHGNRAISQLLGISEHTVKFHLASIYGKLGVANRTEAAQQALRMGILEI